MDCSSSLSLSRKRRKNGSHGENDEVSAGHSISLSSKRARLSQKSADNTGNSTLKPDREHRCGKVLRMHLTNFMCHANLTIDFIKNINFLIGTNGSGKSAILAALVLGLGGKAKDTNRAGSLKQFLKTGETSGKIEITLHNGGPTAYEPEKYGNAITIVRNITQSASNYTIKSQYGQVISKKYDDLARIMLYHNIQIDNNVFVLNQDSAREFLKEFEPKKNYRLFLRATQIEMILEKLNDCHHAQKEHKYSLRCNEKAMEQAQLEIKQLKEKLQQIMSTEKIRDLVKDCETEMLWLNVTELETELQDAIDNINKLEERKEHLLNQVQNKDELEIQLTQQMNVFKSNIVEKTTSYNHENTSCMNIKGKLQSIHKRCTEIQAQLDSLKKRKNYCETQIREIETHIEERSKQNVGDIAETRQRNEHTILTLRREKEEKSLLINSIKQEMQTIIDSKLQKEDDLKNLRHSKDGYNEQKGRITRDISMIKNKSKDNLLIYGEHIPMLRAEIVQHMRAGKFSEMPRGPIGNYIQVSNPKYRNVVEFQLSSVLQAFIVSNKKDRQTLEAIYLKRFPNVRYTIITAPFQNKVYDVLNGSVTAPPGTTLLMNEIKCADPVIMNCLIDRLQVETILLADTKEIAEHLTAYSENVPTNLQKVFVPQLGLEYHSAPKYRMYSIKIAPARFLEINISDRIKQMERELAEIDHKIKLVDVKLNELGPLLRADAKKINEKRQLVVEYETATREMREKISELENYEYPEYNEVDVLKRELASNMRKLEEIQQKIDEKRKELNDVQSEQSEVEREYRHKEKEMRAIEKEISDIKSNVEGITIEMRNITSNCKQNEMKLKKLEDALQQLQLEKDEKSATLENVTSKAQALGDRVPTNRSKSDIDDELRKLKARLRQRSQITDDPAELSELIQCKEEKLEIELRNLKELHKAVNMLLQSLNYRFHFIQTVRNHMVFLLDYSFNRILNLRKFIGNIRVDHGERKLDVTVIPRQTANSTNSVSTTRSLSGGERSYSTVAFLVALWSCVDHPFFFLDEYDVFTDEVNREFITRLLINEGEIRWQRQYVFLTPQDLAIEAREDIKINRLAEPQRRH